MNLIKNLAYGAFVIVVTVGTIAGCFVLLAGGYAVLLYGVREVLRELVT